MFIPAPVASRITEGRVAVRAAAGRRFFEGEPFFTPEYRGAWRR
jgi:hypothetical protein